MSVRIVVKAANTDIEIGDAPQAAPVAAAQATAETPEIDWSRNIVHYVVGALLALGAILPPRWAWIGPLMAGIVHGLSPHIGK